MKRSRQVSPAGARLLSVRQVAALLSMSVRSVWRLAATGELPEPIHLTSRIVRWRLADLEEYVADLEPDGGE